MEPARADLTALLSDTLEEALLLLDGAGAVVFASRAAREMLGDADAATVDGLLVRVIAEDRETVRAHLSAAPTAPTRVRFRVAQPGSAPRPLELRVEPVPGGLAARLRDVVLPRGEPQAALERIAAHLHDVLWLVDVRRERLLYVSPAYESLFGRSRDTLLAGPSAFYEAVHEADRERLAKASLEGVETGFVEEFRIALPDGRVRWVRHRSAPVRGEDGSTLTVGITTDIDEQRRSERARLDAERRFEVLCGNAFETMTELDARFRIAWSSDRTASFFGERGGQRRRPRVDLVHPEDRVRVDGAFAEAVRERRTASIEFRATDRDGRWRWLETTFHPFETEDGEPRSLFVSRDVSERRELVQQVEASEERFRLMADNAHDLITEHDATGRVLWANRRAVEASGYSFEELTSNSPMEHMHPEDRDRIAPRLWQLAPGGERLFVTFRSRHGDGSWRWYEANLHTHLTAAGETRLVSVARDVTDRKQAEDRLRESEERHRQLFELSPEGVVVHALGRVLYANPAAVRLVGAGSADALCDQPVAGFLDAGATGSEGPRELFVRRLDGTQRAVIGSHSAVRFDGRAATQTLLHDITEWRAAERERERLAVQLQEARKLESLGVLAGGIAHDFNNLLAVILGNVNFARRQAAGDAETQAALSDAVDAGESAARLTRQLLAYAGRRAPEVRPVDLSEHVRSLQGLLEAALPKKLELCFALADGLPSVRADVVQLEQVTMNLVRNAAEAIGAREGRVTVSTGNARVAPDAPQSWAAGDDLAAGDYPYLEVRDDGDGMDEETRARIFDPFFTTKKGGHGLGLSAVLGLVRGHGGGIAIETEPGRGTAIRVHLPASEQEVAAEADGTPVVAPTRASVLVADDEPGVRRMLRRMLEARGCTVLEAEDGLEATRRCREDLTGEGPARIDLVILDLNMPRAGGEEALREIRALRPELPVLLSSGDDESLLAERVRDDRHTDFLSKPYLEAELFERMGALLQPRG